MAVLPKGTPPVAVNGVSYAEFIRRKRANPKMKNTTWAGYTQYVQTTRNQKAAQRGFDKTAALYPTINPNRYASQYAARLQQTPDYIQRTPQQLQQEASGQIMPLYNAQMDELTKAIMERSRTGSAAIQGYTNAYLGTLPAVQQNIGNIWQEARNLQGQSSAALGQFAQQSNQQLTGEMAAAEQAAGQTSAGSAMVGQVGAGSANAAAANDWSTQARLIQEGAGAQQWGASLPAVAGAFGADTMRSFQSDLNQDLQSGLGELRSAGRQDIMSMYQSLLSRELQKDQFADTARGRRGELVAGAYSDAYGMQADVATTKASIMAQMQRDAEGYNQDAIAAATPDPTKAPVPGYDAAGNPIIPRGVQIQKRWGTAVQGISSQLKETALGMAAQSPSGKLTPQGYQALFNQGMEMVRSQMADLGPFTDGQIRGFVRRAFQAAGIVAPTATAKAKPKGPKTQPGRAPAVGEPGGPPERNSGTIQGPGGSRIRIPGIPGFGWPF